MPVTLLIIRLDQIRVAFEELVLKLAAKIN